MRLPNLNEPPEPSLAERHIKSVMSSTRIIYAVFAVPLSLLMILFFMILLRDIEGTSSLGKNIAINDKFFAEVLHSLPLMIVAYFFGLLGGFIRQLSDGDKRFENLTVQLNSRLYFISGTLGMMTYLAMETGFILKLIYPDVPANLSIELSFRGVAIAAFLIGFFASETILIGKSRVSRAITENSKKDEEV